MCEEGFVAGIPAAPAGAYSQSITNKEYAIKAVQLLKQLAWRHSGFLCLNVL
jgi:hypothetical protein